MLVNQLSVFMENKEGRLEQVLETLAQGNININSLSLAEATDYGMLRMMVSDPEAGEAALKEREAEVEKKLRECDLFISIGTSGVVYPAAGFVYTAKYYGADTIEFNLEKTSNNHLFDKHICGKCTQTLPEFLEKLLSMQE